MDETCWKCGGDGGWHDCGEDCCCCLDPADPNGEFWRACDECEGSGSLFVETE